MQTRWVIRTLAAAARWIDRVGLALLFPKADVVLPSLWEQVSGLETTDWNAVEINFLWWAKDALPDEGRACVGKHLARSAACIAPRLVPTLVAANGEPPEDGDPVVETDLFRDLAVLDAEHGRPGEAHFPA